MRISIVLGLGFGDEGKGLATSYLASQNKNTAVVRFSGGHQAGHTVIHNGIRHVFSNFGSGALHGCPAYWSRFCTFYPTAVVNEYEILKKKDIAPKLYVDLLCPVTTPFDVHANRITENKNRHGSCGVGFGATIERHENNFKLFVQDLFFESVLKTKLDNIHQYYGGKNVFLTSHAKSKADFLEHVSRVKDIIIPDSLTKENCANYEHIIFEGSQGILLDKDFGFFPNVTRSNTTSKNALLLSDSWGVDRKDVHLYYVTRTYQTRHGNGFMTNEEIPFFLSNNKDETNATGEFQGEFRTGALDIDLLNYALTCDFNFSEVLKRSLIITCADQTGPKIKVTQKGTEKEIEIDKLQTRLHSLFEDCFASMSPETNNGLLNITLQKQKQQSD